MKKKKTLLLPVIAAVAVATAVIVGIWTSTSFRTNGKDSAGQVDAQGITIDKASVTQTASFIDYESGGIAMQVIAVRDSSDHVRVAYNTCQSCNGSPAAYFVQDGTDLVCQNCKLSFPIDALGVAKAGCNPIPISEYTDEEDVIRIPDTELAAHADLFKSWKKG